MNPVPRMVRDERARPARGGAHGGRRAINATALACAAAIAATAVAACGQGSPAPVKTSTATPSPATSPRGNVSPAAATQPAAPAAPASQAPAGPGLCATRSLRVKPGPAQGAAGSTYVAIDFTNVSSESCTLFGYPGVSLTTARVTTPIGLTAGENPTTPRQLVTLPPGQTASAVLRIVNAENYPASRCDPVNARYLQVYPPNQTTSVFLPYRTLTCGKSIRTMTIDAVRPGTGG